MSDPSTTGEIPTDQARNSATVHCGTHVAPGQTAGYIYQCRYGLLAALKRIGTEPSLKISIELLDDVAFHADENPVARLQLKHHLNRAASLTDYCPDLWKTLAIWVSEVAKEPALLTSQQLLLVTTAIAPANSAASFLRTADRNTDQALALLLNASRKSTSQTNAPSYKAFGELPRDTQLALLQAIHVVDRSPSLGNLEGDLLHELRLLAPADSRELALRRVEGWWWSRISEALDVPDRKLIALQEIEACLDGVREEFQIQKLPIDFATAMPPEETTGAYDQRMFVHQLRLIDSQQAPIARAKRDYYRAFEQRSKWSREYLTRSDEIVRFEQNLIEQWEPRFGRMTEEFASEVDDARIPKRRARELFHWIESEARASLRNVSERYLTVGSYHMLADDRRLGWHPDYEVLTKSLPTDEEGPA